MCHDLVRFFPLVLLVCLVLPQADAQPIEFGSFGGKALEWPEIEDQLFVTPRGGLFTGGGFRSQGTVGWRVVDKTPDSGRISVCAWGDAEYFGTLNGWHRSTDAGVSWEPGGLQGYDIRAAAQDGETCYVLAAQPDVVPALFTSEDGKTWTYRSDVSGRALAIGNDGLVLALSGTSAFYRRSTDGGATWTRVELSPLRSIQQAVFTSARAGFGLFPDGLTDTIGVRRSDDEGLTWSDDLLWLPRTDTPVTIAVGPDDAVYVAADSVLVSRDQGATWTRVGLPESLRPVGTVTFADEAVWIGTRSGAARASLAFEDVAPVAGEMRRAFPPFYLSFDEAGRIACGFGTHRYDAKADTWRLIREVASLFVCHSAGSRWVASASRLWRSGDGGQTWQEITIPELSEPPGLRPETIRAIAEIDGSLYLCTDTSGGSDITTGRLFRSDDRGETWIELAGSRGRGYSGFYGLPSGRLLAAVTEVPGSGSTDYSDDGGLSWTRASEVGGFRSIVSSEGRFYATTPGLPGEPTVWSTADGATWTPLAVVANAYDVTATPDGSLFVATGADLLRSRDSGRTWNVIVEEDAHFAVEVDEEGYLYYASRSGGVKRSTEPVAVTSEGLPETALLALTVSPNPARRGATLTLVLPDAENARVEVVDVLGRVVVAMHDGPLAARTHVLRLDAPLPAGAYIARAVVGSQAVTQRFTIVR
ncbi:MAG: T9SS type A sorting domain-containing protein [Bacteroidota bacterium]